MDNAFENRIFHEFKKHFPTLVKQSFETMNEYQNDCIEMGINPETLRKIQYNDSKLYRLLYIAVQEYHNCLSQYLRNTGIELPDLDNLLSCVEDRPD